MGYEDCKVNILRREKKLMLGLVSVPEGSPPRRPESSPNENHERILERQAVSLPLDPLCGYSKIVPTLSLIHI